MSINLDGFTPLGYGRAYINNDLVEQDESETVIGMDIDPSMLRVYSTVAPGAMVELPELLTMNLHLAGFKVGPWSYTRGRKTTRSYISTVDGIDVARIKFHYTFNTATNRLSDVEKHIEFLGIDGEVVVVKDITKEFSISKMASLGREIRQNQIDYLEGFADVVKPEFEPYIELLFTHYSDVIRSYVEYASNDFATRVANEDTPTIAPILGAVAREANSEGWPYPFDITIGQAILAEITGQSPV